MHLLIVKKNINTINTNLLLTKVIEDINMNSKKYKCTVEMYVSEDSYIKISKKMEEILELHPEIYSISLEYYG